MIVLTGTVLKADEPNLNGHIYPLDILKDAIKNVQSEIHSRSMIGRIGRMPAPHTVMIPDLRAASHVIRQLYMYRNKLMCKAESLMGNSLQLLLNTKPLGFALRALGIVNPNGTIRNLTIISVDITSNPAFPNVIKIRRKIPRNNQ